MTASRAPALERTAFAALLFLLPLVPSLAEDVGLRQGVMEYRWETTGEIGPEGERTLALPLRKTSVVGEVSGFVARVTVQQFFSNPSPRPIEAIYKFPLPANAAVHESVIRIGDRLITAEIKERKAARKKYEKAKASGKRAALLEQERPNIFTQSVANIGPGEEIVVALRYTQELAYDDGVYTFSFPMTVGPRFNPGRGAGHQGTGSSLDTDVVPDASRITPPVLPPALRSGHDIELSVLISAGFPLREIGSPSHDPIFDWQGGSQVLVSLRPEERIPNKDFVLSYSTVGREIETSLLTHRTGDVGYFLLMVQPPAEVSSEEVVPKEMVFVLDCSGSMSGFPMTASKALMKKFIAGMNPHDTFRVIRFSETASALSPRALANTVENRRLGTTYVDSLRGYGGTQMIEGVKAALDFPPDPDRQRMVFFLTDGYIGNETQILDAIRQRVGDTRLYSLGVGSSPNRYLIGEMAREGRGFAQYLRNDEDPAPAVDRLFRRLNRPVLTSVETDWNGLSVESPLPATVPDLFDRQPVFLVGRYREPGTATIYLRGRRGQGWEEIPVDVELPAREPENGSLRQLWARRTIADFMRFQVRREIPEIREAVLGLALEYHLMSKYTSFVAVERRLREGADLPYETVLIPSELPDGMSYEGVFGPAELSMERIKPGDPVLTVRAPEEATSVSAFFPFGLRKQLERDPVSGVWVCRFLVPKDQEQGRYTIQIRIVLPHGDWITTSAEYVVDETAPRFAVRTELVGRTLRFEATPVGGVFDSLSFRSPSEGALAFVIPDVISVVVRPPQGGYVVLRRVLETNDEMSAVWRGDYELPEWYRPGRYSFRFLAVDAARNTFSRSVAVEIPVQEASR